MAAPGAATAAATAAAPTTVSETLLFIYTYNATFLR